MPVLQGGQAAGGSQPGGVALSAHTRFTRFAGLPGAAVNFLKGQHSAGSLQAMQQTWPGKRCALRQELPFAIAANGGACQPVAKVGRKPTPQSNTTRKSHVIIRAGVCVPNLQTPISSATAF